MYATARKLFSFIYQGPDMNTNSPFPKSPREAMPGMREGADDVMQSADKAVNSTRQFANDALDKAENKVRELRGSVDPMVDMLASKAQKLARQSLDMASEAKDRAEQSFRRATDVTTKYVAEQPLRSVLMAAAVGAAVALLINASRHRDHY
jgi:ElaB/YqjD/DUF883 family membrane-anchored ribosome-binding protein